MIRFLRFFLGIALIPFAIAVSSTFYRTILTIDYFSFNLHVFIWGIFLYMAVHLLFYEPNYIYTLGHEVIHVLATWACGGKVNRFQVSSHGGSVSTTKDNFFINVSPYLIPIYSILLIIIFPVMKNIFPFFPFKDRVFTFLLGFTLALHIIMTTRTLKLRQPDIMRSGRFFSIILIYITNLIIVFLILALIVDMKSISVFFKNAFAASRGIYIDLFDKVYILLFR